MTQINFLNKCHLQQDQLQRSIKKSMDMITANPIRDALMEENKTFRDLAQKHDSYEKRLSELANINFPNEEELLEESNLKKKKLAVKDELYTMMNEFTEKISH